MRYFAVYDDRIRWVGTYGDNEDINIIISGIPYVNVVDITDFISNDYTLLSNLPTTHYILSTSPLVLQEKGDFPITQDGTVLSGSPLGYITFSNIPENTTVLFDNQNVTEYVDGSPRSIELTTDEVGEHAVSFNNLHYYDLTLYFEVE